MHSGKHNKGGILKVTGRGGKFKKPTSKTKGFRKNPQRSHRYTGHRG